MSQEWPLQKRDQRETKIRERKERGLHTSRENAERDLDTSERDLDTSERDHDK